MTNKLTHLSNHTVTVVLATDTLDATELDATIDENLETQTPWQVIVWNDPVNLMTYVSYVFALISGLAVVVPRN